MYFRGLEIIVNDFDFHYEGVPTGGLIGHAIYEGQLGKVKVRLSQQTIDKILEDIRDDVSASVSGMTAQVNLAISGGNESAD